MPRLTGAVLVPFVSVLLPSVLFWVALSGCPQSSNEQSTSTPGARSSALVLVKDAADALDVATSGGSTLDNCESWEVHFSPKWSDDALGCEGAIVKFLGEAQKYVVLQAYGFTSEPIIDALVALGDRGISVNIVLDRSDEKQEALTRLLNHRANVHIDRKHAIAHNKVIVVDGVSLETGSFNFTRQAQDHNAENCFFVRRCQPIVAPYLQNFMMHQSHSEPVGK
jgi:phosphatidylserine/phosphatidylglycerophosphate/cardiolipin synthase-like enzyme